MIKKERQLYGLRQFSLDSPFIDGTEDATYTFQVYDFPNKFYLGKNSFKILANSSYLENGAQIIIDIEDAAGNPIYYEFSQIINRDRSRTVVVFIYDTTPIGKATIFIASKLKLNPETGEEVVSEENLNVVWKREILISTSKISTEPIIYATPPSLRFTERMVRRRTFESTGSRFFQLPGRGSSFISLNGGKTSIENTKQLQDIDIAAQTLEGLPSIQSNIGEYSGPIRMSAMESNSIIKSRLYPFTSSMEGGEIVIREIAISSSAPPSIANTLPTVTYSASIIKVINADTIEVYPPFNYNTTYVLDGVLRTYNQRNFSNASNFTASWFNPLSASLGASKSFLELELRDLSPAVGSSEYISIRYKEVGGFGDYHDLGIFEIKPRNLLVDSASIQFLSDGVSEKRIGFLESGDDPLQYWQTSSLGVSNIHVSQSNSALYGGFFVSHSGIFSSSYYTKLELTPPYRVPSRENSEFKLSFLAMPLNSNTTFPPQIDVYISGSKLLRDVPRQTTSLPEVDIDGVFLGSISSKSGSYKEFISEFQTLENSNITPVIVLRSGNWALGSMALESNSGMGYTPNQSKIFAPLPNVPSGQEMLFEVNYLNKNYEPSELTQRISGIYFEGSQRDKIPIGDVFDNKLEYYAGDTRNRLVIGNAGELQISLTSSYGESSTIFFIAQAIGSSDTGGNMQIRFPLYNDKKYITYDTASQGASMIFQVDTVIFGMTGSFSNIKNSYTWGLTTQGRTTINKFDGALLYKYNSFSGSNNWMMGTYGSGPESPKPNLDNWAIVNTAFIDQDSLFIRYIVSSTGSGVWNYYASSTCKVVKFDYRS